MRRRLTPGPRDALGRIARRYGSPFGLTSATGDPSGGSPTVLALHPPTLAVSGPKNGVPPLSASLRVIHVVEPAPPIYDMGEMPLNVPEINASIHADMERAMSERVARLDPRLKPEGRVHDGRPADVLIELTKTVDILIIGSRRYRPLKAVMVGGVSGQVIRSAACPVIVVPRTSKGHRPMGLAALTEARRRSHEIPREITIKTQPEVTKELCHRSTGGERHDHVPTVATADGTRHSAPGDAAATES